MEKDRGEEETKEKIDGTGSERTKNKARNEYREKDKEVKKGLSKYIRGIG